MSSGAAGAWRFTDPGNTVLRKEASRFNNPGEKPWPWNAAPPQAKDHQYYREAAMAGDEQIAAGIHPDKDEHGRKQNGVKASHVFHKLAYWDESIRGPDPMHTIGGCIKHIFTMVTGSSYSIENLRALAMYEQQNGRYLIYTNSAATHVCVSIFLSIWQSQSIWQLDCLPACLLPACVACCSALPACAACCSALPGCWLAATQLSALPACLPALPGCWLAASCLRCLPACLPACCVFWLRAACAAWSPGCCLHCLLAAGQLPALPGCLAACLPGYSHQHCFVPLPALFRWADELSPFLSTAVPSSNSSDSDQGPSYRPPRGQKNKKRRKKRIKHAGSYVMPWKTKAQGARDTEELLRGMVRDGAAPTGIAESNMHFCLTHPGYLKTHEWFVLAGPIGKLALLDRVEPAQYEAICAFFDVCCKLWRKEMPVSSDGDMANLRNEVADAVASLEMVLPAWEMNIMLHLLLHVTDRVELLGPCWAFSMFSFERTWGQLDKWRSQQRHMEACIINAFRAYRTAVIATERLAEQKSQRGSSSSDSDDWDDDDGSHDQQQGLSGDRVYDAALELPREVLRRKLPVYASGGQEMHVWLYDQGKTLYFEPGSRSKQADWWRVELHRHYYNQHHNTYGKVFDKFIQQKRPRVRKKVDKLPFDEVLALLHDFMHWGIDNADKLSREERNSTLYYATNIQTFDRMELNGLKFTCEAKDVTKKSQNHVVAAIADGRPYFGRVQQYVRHVIPSMTVYQGAPGPQHVAELAVVEWFGDARNAPSNGPLVHCDIGCPIVSKSVAQWDTGSLWACSDLLPLNVILVPDPDDDQQWLVLHPSVEMATLGGST